VIRISIVATIYIIIQYIAYYGFGILLMGHISFMPIYSAQIYGEFTYNIKNFYRPTSFFLEPSHLVQYVTIGLILVLFRRKNFCKGDFLKAVFISAAVILSTSVQGIVVLAAIWTIWAGRAVFSKFTIKSVFLIVFFMISIPMVSVLLYNTPIVQNTLSRMMDGSNVLTSNAFLARFQGYSYLDNVPQYLKFIGLGYGSIPSRNIFMSSIAYMLYGGGYFGLVIVLFLFMRVLKKSKNTTTKVIIIVSFILLTATEWLYVYISVYYFSFICYEKNYPDFENEQVLLKNDSSESNSSKLCDINSEIVGGIE
jgi:hypothetical protein